MGEDGFTHEVMSQGGKMWCVKNKKNNSVLSLCHSLSREFHSMYQCPKVNAGLIIICQHNQEALVNMTLDYQG